LPDVCRVSRAAEDGLYHRFRSTAPHTGHSAGRSLHRGESNSIRIFRPRSARRSGEFGGLAPALGAARSHRVASRATLASCREIAECVGGGPLGTTRSRRAATIARVVGYGAMHTVARLTNPL